MERFVDLTAMWAGRCAGCGQRIRRGHQITFDRHSRKTYHVEHAPREAAAPVAARQEAQQMDLARLVAAENMEGGR